MNIQERASLSREVRQVEATEFRADTEGDVVKFHGVASTVDTPYTVRDMFGEYQETMVGPVFRKTLKEKPDVRLLLNHDGAPLARTKSKTLTLTATPDLTVDAELDARSPLVQTVRSAMERGDLDQMSFAFRATRQEWNQDYTERWIREVELLDVSIVTYPANPTTSASLRSLDETIRELTADKENLDVDEVRRVIAHLETLLEEPQPEPDMTWLNQRRLELWAMKKPA